MTKFEIDGALDVYRGPELVKFATTSTSITSVDLSTNVDLSHEKTLRQNWFPNLMLFRYSKDGAGVVLRLNRWHVKQI